MAVQDATPKLVKLVHDHPSARTTGDLFPALAAELERLAIATGRPNLVAQIRHLPVLQRCACGKRNCAHFYTPEKPALAYGPGHMSLLLPSRTRLVAVEVMDRPAVKKLLDAYLAAG